MTTGTGIVIFGFLYLLTTVVGVGLTALRDMRGLRIRLESEERQTEMAAAANQFNVKFTPEELKFTPGAQSPTRIQKKKAQPATQEQAKDGKG